VVLEEVDKLVGNNNILVDETLGEEAGDIADMVASFALIAFVQQVTGET
jgi:hypothetical protein